MPDMFFLIFGIVVAFIGLLILFVVIKDLIKCRKKIDATISSLHVDKTHLRGTTIYSYSPIVSYEFNGNTYESTSPFSSEKKSKYVVGNKLTIYIDEANPESCRFPGKPGLFITGLIISAIGLLFVILYFI